LTPFFSRTAAPVTLSFVLNIVLDDLYRQPEGQGRDPHRIVSRKIKVTAAPMTFSFDLNTALDDLYRQPEGQGRDPKGGTHDPLNISIAIFSELAHTIFLIFIYDIPFRGPFIMPDFDQNLLIGA
jgi:hypothetical protein